jgi:SAM-dependent methyltransferase
MRADEVAKYQRAYSDPIYKMGKRRRQRMQKDIDSIPAGYTLLDIGAGRGETVAYAQQRGLAAVGIELVPELCGQDVFEAPITAIPFDKTDVVTCYDVFEHLPAEDVDPALDEIFRVAQKLVFLTICGNESDWADDVHHLSVHPADWWEAKFYARLDAPTWVRSVYKTEKDWHWRIRL